MQCLVNTPTFQDVYSHDPHRFSAAVNATYDAIKYTFANCPGLANRKALDFQIEDLWAGLQTARATNKPFSTMDCIDNQPITSMTHITSDMFCNIEQCVTPAIASAHHISKYILCAIPSAITGGTAYLFTKDLFTAVALSATSYFDCLID